jgi:hypothetical protein
MASSSLEETGIVSKSKKEKRVKTRRMEGGNHEARYLEQPERRL